MSRIITTELGIKLRKEMEQDILSISTTNKPFSQKMLSEPSREIDSVISSPQILNNTRLQQKLKSRNSRQSNSLFENNSPLLFHQSWDKDHSQSIVSSLKLSIQSHCNDKDHIEEYFANKYHNKYIQQRGKNFGHKLTKSFEQLETKIYGNNNSNCNDTFESNFTTRAQYRKKYLNESEQNLLDKKSNYTLNFCQKMDKLEMRKKIVDSNIKQISNRIATQINNSRQLIYSPLTIHDIHQTVQVVPEMLLKQDSFFRDYSKKKAISTIQQKKYHDTWKNLKMLQKQPK